MNYSKVLNDSFNIFWNHRSLWFFGVIAAFFGQSDYRFRVNYTQGLGSSSGEDSWFNPGVLLEWIVENPIPYLIALVGLSLLWWTISAFLGWLAQGALIGMVDEIDRTGATSVGQGWAMGRQHALSLFVISLILTLPLLILLLIALAILLPFLRQVLNEVFYENFSPDLFIESFFRLMVYLVPLACIGFFLGIILRLLNLIAARSCVLEGLGPLESLRRGWSVLTRNIGYILLTGLILSLVSATFGAIVGIPALLLWLPAAGAFLYEEWSFLALVSLIAALLYTVIIGIGLSGILTSFNSTLWTELYKAFLEKEADLDFSVIR